MLSWVYISNIFANVAFWDRPAVALWGGVLMGIVLIPWWLRAGCAARAARRGPGPPRQRRPTCMGPTRSW